MFRFSPDLILLINNRVINRFAAMWVKTISKYNDTELDLAIKLITEKIRFISVELVPLKLYSYAESLTKGIDIDDTAFVALAMFING